MQLTGFGAGVIGEAGVGDVGGEEDDPLQPKPMVKKKKKAGRTNKVGCTATIIMKEVIYYPEFQVGGCMVEACISEGGTPHCFQIVILRVLYTSF